MVSTEPLATWNNNNMLELVVTPTSEATTAKMQTAQRFALNARLDKSNMAEVKPNYNNIVNCAQGVTFRSCNIVE